MMESCKSNTPKESVFGVVPANWDISKLKWVADLVLGKMLQDKEPVNNNGEYTLEPYLKSKNIGWLELFLGVSEVEKMWFNTTEKNLYQLSDGDIVMNEGGDIGKVALWHDLDSPYYIQNSVHRITPKEGIILSEYLCFYLYAISKTGYFWSIVNPISIAHLTKEKLENTPVVVPSIDEQHRIVNYLNRKTAELNSVLGEYESQLADLRDYRLSIISESVSHGIKPIQEYKDLSLAWISSAPLAWKPIRVKYSYYLKGRIGWQGLKADEFTKEGPFLVTGTDFEGGRVDWSRCYHITEERYNEAPEIHVNKGDILITKDGTVGKVAYIDDMPEKVSLNSHLLIMRPTKPDISNRFLFWVIQSSVFDRYNSYSQTGTIMASLSQEKIGNFIYYAPSFEEQEAIADYLDKKVADIDSAMSLIQSQIDDIKAYKDTVIYEAVTGKINKE